MSILVLNDLVSVTSTWHEVHNVYLQYGVELGVPGLLLFLMIMADSFGSTIVVCRRSARDSPPRELFHLSEGLQGSLVAFAVGALFAPVAYNFYFYYLAGLATGMRQAIGSFGVKTKEPMSPGIRGEQRLTRPSLRHSTSR